MKIRKRSHTFLLYLKEIGHEIKNQIGKLKNSGSFAQNVAVVFSGNIFGLILQVALTPIISRIYGPVAYGEFAFYNLIITNIALVGSISLPSVYILSKARYKFLALAKLVLVNVTLLSLLLFIFYLLFKEFFDFAELPPLFFALGILVILFQNVNAILIAWNERSKSFKRNTLAGTVGNVMGRGGVISMGLLFTPSGIGLLTGDLLRMVTTFCIVGTNRVRLIVLRFMVSSNFSTVREAFRENINVPKYIFPSQWLVKLTSDLPILFISAVYGKEYLGLYAFAFAILNIPINIVSRSIRPVLLQKANELYQSGKNSEFTDFMQKVILIAMITFMPILVLTYFSREIFSFAFGTEWIEAGTVVQAMCFYVILSTISQSISGIRRVIRKEKMILRLSIIGLIFKVIPFVTYFMNLEFKYFLFIYAAFNSAFILFSFLDLFLDISSKKDAFRIFFLSTLLALIGMVSSIICIFR